MEVGAVAAPHVARADRVAATPALAGLVVGHAGCDVLVDGARFFERGGCARRGLLRSCRDLSVDRDHGVAAQVLGAGLVAPLRLALRPEHAVRAPRDYGFELELDAVREWRVGGQVQQAVAVAMFPRESVLERGV